MPRITTDNSNSGITGADGSSGAGGVYATTSRGSLDGYVDADGVPLFGDGASSHRLPEVDKLLASLGKPLHFNPDEIWAMSLAGNRALFDAEGNQRIEMDRFASLSSRQAVRGAFEGAAEKIKAAKHALKGALIKMAMTEAGGAASIALGGVQIRQGSRAAEGSQQGRELTALKEKADVSMKNLERQQEVVNQKAQQLGHPLEGGDDPEQLKLENLEFEAQSSHDAYKQRLHEVAEEHGHDPAHDNFRADDFHSYLQGRETTLNNQAMAVGGTNNATGMAISGAGDVGASAEDLKAKEIEAKKDRLEAVSNNLQGLATSQRESSSRAQEAQQATIANMQQAFAHAPEIKG